METVACARKLCGQTQTVSFGPYAALDKIGDTERPADRGRVLAIMSLKRRCARRDLQVWPAGQLICDLFREPLTEMTERCIVAHDHERQHRD